VKPGVPENYAESVGEFQPRVAATLGFRFLPLLVANSERVAKSPAQPFANASVRIL